MIKTYTPKPGDRLTDVVKEMLYLTYQIKGSVSCIFNGLKLSAHTGSSFADVMRPWDEEQARFEAKRQKELQRKTRAREKKLKSVKIIEPNLKKLALDSHGIWKIGKLTINLLYPSQLERLPKGTKLYTINGEVAIVGVDDFDTDTRGGFVAFGVKVRK